MCGQKDKVHELCSVIHEKMYTYAVQQKSQVSSKSLKLGLPVDTERLPSYWKVNLFLLD